MQTSVVYNDFQYGTIDSVDDASIPETASSRALNWRTKSTKVELRGGYARLGATDNQTGKPVQGLAIAQKIGLTGTQDIIFRKRGRKLEYYDLATDDWIESGTDAFPALAENDECSFANYVSVSGSYLYAGTPNMHPLKVVVANPASVTDLTDTSKNTKGHIAIKQNRMIQWDGKDRTGVRGSYIDKDEATDFTQISAEAIGVLGTKTYTGTLAFKGSGALRTCFEVTFTDGSETIIDNFDGTLTGSAGGTGTINYTTGVYSITFKENTVGAVTATYRWENSTSEGVADFSKSSPRTAGQGFVFRQDDGGGVMNNLLAIGGTEYCMHEYKTWALTLSDDDTAATNIVYRDRVGIPFFRAGVETGDGIYYIDATDNTDPHLRLLSFDAGGSEVIPKSVSKRLKYNNERIGKSFVGYSFDKACVEEWGDYIVIACRQTTSAVNNRVFTYNKQTGAIDEHDFFVSCFAVYKGALLGGDSVSGNVHVLFSGIDDDSTTIANYWEGALNNFGMEKLKKQRKIVVQGEIGKEQEILISIAIDRGNFTEVGSIRGDGTYVDLSQRVVVGAVTVGEMEVGGGSDGIEAHNYMREFKLNIEKFRQVKLRFEALGLGYASVSMVEMKDIRQKWNKLPEKYR